MKDLSDFSPIQIYFVIILIVEHTDNSRLLRGCHQKYLISTTTPFKYAKQ